MNQNISEIVKNATVQEDDRIKLFCKTAFELSEKHNLDMLDIARVCNNEGIKIAKCQLGCFK
jgi:hypothetical protein